MKKLPTENLNNAVQQLYCRILMEIRKVQVAGGSSLVITLPKEWVNSLNIQKNDPLGLIVQPDGTLLITSRTTGGTFSSGDGILCGYS
ncbi:MAG: AbrB/MazE/SpoVT family DNA-binding domain-containing protein [Candidatus Methanofastidiosia archaeon]